MLFSRNDPTQVVELRSHKEFVERIEADTTPEQRAGAILLVGSGSHTGESLRLAQAPLRMDGLASHWSHAALILDWRDDARKAVGAEVSLEPESVETQAPERNGVTLFSLPRYLSPGSYPNLALATFGAKEGQTLSRPLGETIREAVAQPNSERYRFRFMDLLALWSGYALQPHGRTNPLLDGVPMPGAALCEYAFEKAGVDLTPGATSPNACPELIWTTLLRWSDEVAESIRVHKVFAVLRERQFRQRQPLSSSLHDDIGKRIQ